MKKHFLMLAMIMSMFIVCAQAQVTALYESFESGIPSDWTVLDVDGDGATWTASSEPISGGNTGQNYAISYDATSMDNWIITKPVTLGSNAMLSFWKCTLFRFEAEHYAVYVSTTTADPSAFSLLREETNDLYGWRYEEISLSAYAGQTVYIAFRHFNSSTRFLVLDDITVTMESASPIITTAPTELNFGSVPVGSPSPSKSLSVAAFNVTSGVTVTSAAPFEVSLNNSTFTNTISLPDTGGIVYVRYFPVTVNADSTALTVTGGTATQTVILTGVSLDCSSIALPYTQNFDSTPQNTITSCWYQINPYQGFPSASSFDAYSGLSLMFMSDDDDPNPTYAVMPLMPQNLSNLQITFWTARGGMYSGTFSLGYVTDPSDGSTFVPLWTRTAAQMGNDDYHPITFSFSDVSISPDTNYYIAFKYNVNTGWGWYVDNIVVEEIAACALPTGLTVNGVTSNSATLTWTGEVDSYVVYYKTTSATAWDSVPNVTLDTAGFVLTNLLPSTNYVWYVASVCEDGSYANSLENSTFKTECAIYTIPFNEDFNAQNSIPECWEKLVGLASSAFAGTNPTHTNATSGWTISTTLFGNNHPKINILGSNTTSWLVSPSINLSGVSNPALVFDLALTDAGNANPIENPSTQADDKFMVIISTDDGATWSAANATVWSDNAAVGDYPFSQIATTGQEVILLLDAYADQTVRIAFYGESQVSGGDNDLHIDNVKVIQTPSCARPAGLTVDNITYNSVEIFWEDNSQVGSWLLEYKGDNDTVWTTQVVTDTIIQLTGLDDYTHYDLRVSADCGNNEYSLSANASFTTKLMPMPLPYSTDFSATNDRKWSFDNGTCRNRWTIGALENESALFVSSNGTSANYNTESFSIVSTEKVFRIGTATEISISFDIRVGGEENFDYVKVFFAPEEAAYPASTMFESYANYDYATHALHFPASLSSYPYIINRTGGNTVHVEVSMPNPNINPTDSSLAKLVFLWKNDQTGGSQPSAVISNLSVISLTCTTPTNMTFSNVTTNSATVNWTSTGTETDWNLEYRAASDTAWIPVPVFATNHTFTGLTLGTTYKVRVQADCGNRQSLWLEGTFTTFCDPMTEFPYTEDFENNGAMPDCWMQEYVIDEMDWTMHTGNDGTITTAHSGDYNAYFFNNEGYFTTKFVSPIFDLTGVENPYLSYWYTHAAFVNHLDILKVYYRTSTSSPWMLLSTHNVSVTSWEMDSLLLPTPTATYQIAFEGRVNSGHGITLDDITIASAGPSPIIEDTCETPTGLTQVVNTKEVGSITVNWTDHAGASQWNLQYRPMNGIWTTVVVTGTPSYTIPDLVNDEQYEIHVQAVCDENNLSEWSAILIATATNSGIEDHLQNSITLYPNPAKEVVNVQCAMNNVQFDVTEIEVYDVFGKVVRTVISANDHSLTQINVSGLADGMYFVRVTTNQGVVTKRFVKK